MNLTELEFAGAQPPIDSYAPGGFRLAGEFIEGSIILSPEGAEKWPPAELTAQGAASLAQAAKNTDVLLVGLGAELVAPPQEFRTALETAGVAYDVMSTPSACRTYNVLLSENRRVAAALIAL